MGSGGGGGCIGSGATEEGEESGGGGSLLLVQEEVLGNPKSSVSEDDSESKHKRGDQDRSDAGEEDDEDAEPDQAPERLSIGKCTAEEDEGLIGGTEEIQEEPRRQETKENEERDRVGKERNGEDAGDDRHVVDAEVGVILADAEGRVGEGLRLGESRAVEEFRPRAALGEAVAEGIGDVADECPECWSRDRSL